MSHEEVDTNEEDTPFLDPLLDLLSDGYVDDDWTSYFGVPGDAVSLDDPKERPLTFHDVLSLIYDLHAKKQQDYGRVTDPFANIRKSEDFGIPAWVGCLVRANDKIGRLQKVAGGGTLVNEGIWDSLLDLATYSVIAAVLWAEQEGVMVSDEDADEMVEAE